MDLFWVWLLILQTTLVSGNTDPSSKISDQVDRVGRSWFSSSATSQHKQNQPASFTPTSTNKPGNNADSSDPSGAGRNFEEQDKTVVSAASEQDFLQRHYGYLNVHRFDPNFPYYDRQPYPRYPSPHPSSPRFGPGYRKDKYGHGYGYSCKHGDDCDEVRAANQIPLRPPPPPVQPPHGSFPHHKSPPTPYNSAFVDASAFPNVPHYPGQPSFPPFSAGGLYPPSPARFNDPHLPLPHQMAPSRFYHGRYLHDQDDPHGKADDTKLDSHSAGLELRKNIHAEQQNPGVKTTSV